MDCCGIGLVEVVWKVVAKIVNLRLTAFITYHEFSMDSGQVPPQVPPPLRPN